MNDKKKKKLPKSFKALHRYTRWYDPLIKFIRQIKLFLFTISTRKKELEKLRVKGRIISAKYWLNILRKGTGRYNRVIELILEEAHDGNFSLDDIGTSEEELEELRVKGEKRALA